MKKQATTNFAFPKVGEKLFQLQNCNQAPGDKKRNNLPTHPKGDWNGVLIQRAVASPWEKMGVRKKSFKEINRLSGAHWGVHKKLRDVSEVSKGKTPRERASALYNEGLLGENK